MKTSSIIQQGPFITSLLQYNVLNIVQLWSTKIAPKKTSCNLMLIQTIDNTLELNQHAWTFEKDWCIIIFHLCRRPLIHRSISVLNMTSLCVLDDLEGYGSVEERSVYGVENSSMFLECSPKSQRALIYWQLQRPNDEHKHEVHTHTHTLIHNIVQQNMHLNDMVSLWSKSMQDCKEYQWLNVFEAFFSILLPWSVCRFFTC